jgi:hypothetical protein
VTKRRKKKPVEELFQEFRLLDVDVIRQMQRDESTKLNFHRLSMREAHSRLDSLNRAMNYVLGRDSLGISDHAVVRYLERRKGIDIGEVRREIRTLVESKYDRNVVDQVIDIEGVGIAISDGSIVTTILTDMEPSERYATLRPTEPPGTAAYREGEK